MDVSVHLCTCECLLLYREACVCVYLFQVMAESLTWYTEPQMALGWVFSNVPEPQLQPLAGHLDHVIWGLRSSGGKGLQHGQKQLVSLQKMAGHGDPK